MTLNDLYLVSQIAIATLGVPTLLYLALQVRQNTKQLRASARYQFVEASGQMNAITAASPQVASVFRRGMETMDALDPDERMQFFVIVGQFFQIYSTMYELHLEKLLSESQWTNIRKDILALMHSGGGRRVWEEFARPGLDRSFTAYVDALAASGETSYRLERL